MEVMLPSNVDLLSDFDRIVDLNSEVQKPASQRRRSAFAPRWKPSAGRRRWPQRSPGPMFVNVMASPSAE
jgi:hypothetical protein